MPLPTELEPGRYYWRVAARSPGGMEGPFSHTASFLAVHRPRPPAELAVAFEGEQLVFSWRPVADAERYQVQLSAQKDFLRPLAERTSERAELALPRPEPGIYYYRARSIGPGAENLGRFGASERIVIPQATYWPYLVLPVLPFLL